MADDPKTILGEVLAGDTRVPARQRLNAGYGRPVCGRPYLDCGHRYRRCRQPLRSWAG